MPIGLAQRRSTIGRTGALERAPAVAVPALAWLLGFVPVTYLALSGGGYDIVARSEVAIGLWWLVLLGSLFGLFPRARLTAGAWAALAILAAYLAWTWTATGWTQSHELTLGEVARVASYTGVLALGLCVVDSTTVRPLLCGLAAAVALVSALAVLSRLVPSWFPTETTANLYATARLSYPFDYSDGVGEFAALGLPLLLYAATSARTLLGRALAAAGIPGVALCLALTVSRGGIFAAVVGLVVLLALARDRLGLLVTMGAALCACAVEIVAIGRRVGVRSVLNSVAPAGERHSVLVVFVLASVGLALVQVGIGRLLRDGRRPGWLVVSRRQAGVVGGAVAVVVVGLVIALIASGTDHRLWQHFKEPNPPAAGNEYSRLLSLSGSHRYQYWQAAISAYHTDPWKGIGPGTFRFWWAQHNSLHEFVLNAHSWFIETLAELGLIGLLLVGGFAVYVLVSGAVRALGPAADAAAGPGDRGPAAAAATATFAAFCAGAAFDWVWQIGAVPFVAMLAVAAVFVSPRPEAEPRGWTRALIPRAALVVGTLVALWAIAVPLAETAQVRASQAAARRGDLRSALDHASSAQNLEPSAASPRLQEALVYERLGAIAKASDAIAQAIDREPTNWSLWLTASRIATEADRPRKALADYRRARALNPTSPLFAQ
jgi:hypothetical protein